MSPDRTQLAILLAITCVVILGVLLFAQHL